MESVTISGSHGRLTVHAVTGYIIARYLDDDEYVDIAFFDPVPIARWSGDLDILAAGYWTFNGDHAEPLTMRLVSWRDEMIVDDWVPMRLLAPN
ncbi:hypothetical protein [Sphingomonas oryzagri]